MNFSKVKSHLIPEGKAISLSIDGVVIWQGGLKASTISITDGVLTITNTDDRVEKFVVISNTETVLVLNADGTVATISFTIDGTEYKALEGMTWGEWVESEYNTGGFYVGGYSKSMGDSGYAITNAERYVVRLNHKDVYSKDVITATDYDIVYIGSGDAN